MGPTEVKHGGGVMNHDSSILLVVSKPFAVAAASGISSSLDLCPAAAATYTERIISLSAVARSFWPHVLRPLLTVRDGLNDETLKPLLFRLLL